MAAYMRRHTEGAAQYCQQLSRLLAEDGLKHARNRLWCSFVQEYGLMSFVLHAAIQQLLLGRGTLPAAKRHQPN